MNQGHQWTAEEELAAVELEWDAFSFQYRNVSYDAYRQRRAKLTRGSSDLERAVANNVKMARSVIRLRHSIEADDELAAAIPLIRARLQAEAQNGQVQGLGYDDLRLLIYGQ